MFKIDIGLVNIKSNAILNRRVAVRSVIYNQNSLLMVQSKNGEYKFPGGGVKIEEDLENALLREVREETGFTRVRVLSLLGEAIERKKDMFNEDEFFEMNSQYYLCELINDDTLNQDLDDYERDLEYKPVFIGLEEAIESNEKLIDFLYGESRRWTLRDTLVMKELLRDRNLV